MDIAKLNSKNFPTGNSLTKNDIVIILGDAGLVWDGSKTDMYWRKWLNDKPWTTFCVLGNHENYNLIEQIPIVDKFGGKVRQVESSIFYAVSGEIYNFNEKKALVVNGADSIDREFRKPNISWWEQEQITEDSVIKAKKSLKKVNDKIDLLLTHTGGSLVTNYLGFVPTTSDLLLDQIIAVIKGNYRHLLGHYHVDMSFDNKRIMYDDIIEI